MRLQAVLISVILKISSMSLNSEASHVSFLNQTLLQIEKYIKNGQDMNSVILKHVSVFALEQLVTRILSSKFIWLLLKYKTTDELGTHSDPRRKNISITHNSLS